MRLELKARSGDRAQDLPGHWSVQGDVDTRYN